MMGLATLRHIDKLRCQLLEKIDKLESRIDTQMELIELLADQINCSVIKCHDVYHIKPKENKTKK